MPNTTRSIPIVVHSNSSNNLWTQKTHEQKESEEVTIKEPLTLQFISHPNPKIKRGKPKPLTVQPNWTGVELFAHFAVQYPCGSDLNGKAREYTKLYTSDSPGPALQDVHLSAQTLREMGVTGSTTVIYDFGYSEA